MGMLKQHIYELQQNRLTNPAAIKTANNRIICPRDVFVQFCHDFASEEWQSNPLKRTRKLEQFTFLWAGQGEIIRPKNAVQHAACTGIQTHYDYCALRPGQVAQRRWQCYCNGCIELMRVGPAGFVADMDVPGCLRASEEAYAFSKRATQQLGSAAASKRSGLRRKNGQSMARQIKTGDFCLFQNRARDGQEELWLGRAVSVPPHHDEGQCCKQVATGKATTIARVRYDVGDYMIGVQWYAKGERGLYRRWDAELPGLQNSSELVAIGVEPEKVSGPALPQRALRSGSRGYAKAVADEAAREKKRRYRIADQTWAVALGSVV